MDEKSLTTLEFDKVLDRLAEYTSFSAGQNLARQVKPTDKMDEATIWQIQTHEARLLLDRRSDVSIGGARDVRRQADNAERGFILYPEDLLEIRSTIAAARELRRKLEKSEEVYPHLVEIGKLIEECPGLISAISEALDERGEILDSASPKLATIRKELRILYGRIQDKLQSLINSSANQYLQESTISMRGGRYVIPLKSNHKGRIKGIVHDQSNSGATLWIEPLNTVELNNDYRSLQIAEDEEIRRILAELSALVATFSESIKRVVERMAELDLIFARARYANVTDAVKPEFTRWRKPAQPRSKKKGTNGAGEEDRVSTIHPGSTIWIRGARHPLLDPDTVVPTDLLVGEDTFIVLITGPNTGGKTVSLKTTGLMVLMAQSGLHLPAVEARLTVFDNVFADIGDEQSIEQNLSTFSGHLTNITHITARVDDRSLVLLDELGSGTDPAEGAALAQSIVSFLRDRGATTFVATHFPELKVYASQTPGVTNASLLFDVDTLMPTFEMTIGMPGRSNAFAIARRLGLEETIIDDALQLIGASSEKAESLLDAIYEMRERMSSQEAGTRLALRIAESERNELEEQLKQIEAERRKVLDEARLQAEEELDTVRREIGQVRKQLRSVESRSQLKKLQKQTEEIEEEMLATVHVAPARLKTKKRSGKEDEFQIGDTVLVKTIGTKGQIVVLDKKEAEVAIGRLRMRANLEELEFKERADATEEQPLPVGRPKPDSPGMELDLRGLRVEEGIQNLEQYLDSAFLANLPWVRIIHGKGTGRLREAVRKILKEHNHVTSWEEGRDGEGGAGVTVAKLTEE